MDAPDFLKAEQTKWEEELWLLGQPPLDKYIDFVRDMAVDGSRAQTRALVDEWRAANDYYYELEESEAGIADRIECKPLDPRIAHLAEQVEADPRFRNSFDAVPVSFGMVELDQLVVFQIHARASFVDRLRAKLGTKPDLPDLFRFCMPLDGPSAPVHVRQVGEERFVFSCRSLDFRFHRPVLLRPEQICDYESYGSIGGVVALIVGFSANLLSAVRSENRLVLHNGYHRAIALRAAGITHAPCVIETVTRTDELDLVAKERVAENPAFYFRAKRPPLLKDFFDPKICKRLPVYPSIRMVEVGFEVRDFMVPE